MEQSYRSPQPGNTSPLSEAHRTIVEDGSAIAPEVWGANGAATVKRRAQLPKCYSERQRRRLPGILFTVHHYDGTTSTIFRPDKPRTDSPGHKYEQEVIDLGGAGNVLGIHPWQRHLWDRLDVPVWIVEGQKKLLSVVTALWRAGLLDTVLVVSVSGTWNWCSSGPIPHLLALPVEGRLIRVWYDSDLSVKRQVRDADNELCRHLDGRGAEVEVVISPAMPDGSKRGADDHLASGGTLDESSEWCVPWTPETFSGDAMMERSPELRDAVDRAKRLLWDRPPGGRGDPSDYKIIRALVELSPEFGRVLAEDPDWLFVDVSKRKVIARAAISSATLYSRRDYLEANSAMRMGKRKSGRQASGFYLFIGKRAKVKHKGTDSRLTQHLLSNTFREALYACVLPLRTPALRASSPGWKPSKKRIEQARKNNTTLPDSRPPIRRPGPRVGQALDVHDVCQQAGYVPTDAEVAAALGIKRVRDYKRRIAAQLRELRLVSDSGTLAPGWLDALEIIREHGEEQEQGRLVRDLHASEREKYRERMRSRLRQREHRRPRKQEPRASRGSRRAYTEAEQEQASELLDKSVRAHRRLVAEGMDRHDAARIVRDSMPEQPMSQAERDAKAVELGMREKFIGVKVYRYKPPAKAKASEAAPQRPHDPADPGGNWRDHSLACECLRCSATEPRYARPATSFAGGAA